MAQIDIVCEICKLTKIERSNLALRQVLSRVEELQKELEVSRSAQNTHSKPNVPNSQPPPAIDLHLIQLSNRLMASTVSGDRAAPQYNEFTPEFRSSSFNGIGTTIASSFTRPTITKDMEEGWRLRKTLNDLPIFYGNHLMWPSFYKRYIQDNMIGQFLPHEKRDRLDKALKGTARKLVERYLENDNGCDKAINLLDRVYGQSADIARELSNKLAASPKITSVHDANIVELSATVGSYVSAIETLGRPLELKNQYLLGVLEEKLSIDASREWSIVKMAKRQYQKCDPDISDMSAFLENLLLQIPPHVLQDKLSESKASRQIQILRGQLNNSQA